MWNYGDLNRTASRALRLTKIVVQTIYLNPLPENLHCRPIGVFKGIKIYAKPNFVGYNCFIGSFRLLLGYFRLV